MAKRNFNEWIKTFIPSISNFEYYCDFEKIYRNVDKFKVEINILNSLIGSKKIEDEFADIVKKYPGVIQCVPILLAIREKEIYAGNNGNIKLYDFNDENLNVSDCVVFMRETGLFDLLQKHIISNLYDYVMGVETGLDSNGRKNRGGHLMENLVEKYICESGFEKDKDYFKEMNISEITQKWSVDLSKISNNGKTEKRFDFVVKTEKFLYLIETNFYSSSGSKLNETSRSYKNIAEELKYIDKVKFIWFTDGLGWMSAKHNLEETFDVLDTIYCINDIKNGIMREIFI